MIAKAQIFLSYTQDDEKQVNELYQVLSKVGFKPWMDKKDILGGETWERKIEKALEQSDFFVACLSKKSVDRRGFLQRETKQALDIWQNKLDSDIYIIPLKLEECELPESLRKFQIVPLYEDDGYERLIEAIQVGLERQLQPDAEFHHTRKIVLTFDMYHKKFNADIQFSFQKGLGSFLNIPPRAVRITMIEKASVKVTIELTEQSAERVMSAYQNKDSKLAQCLEPLILLDVKKVEEKDFRKEQDILINFDIYSGPNTIFASVYSDEEWRKWTHLRCESRPVSDRSLQLHCQQAEQALDKAIASNVSESDWNELLRIGRSIAAVIPDRQREKLANLMPSFRPNITLRLRDNLIAMPWELMYIGENKLLIEKFEVGRQIVAPADTPMLAPREALHEPVRVLIVVDSTLGFALEEGRKLCDTLKQYGSKKVNVDLLSDVTRNDLLREIPDVDILHFAGDAEIDPQNDEKIGWRLGHGETFDNESIEASGIDHWPFLVFANACRTGQMVRRIGTWGLDSMAFAFLKYGVSHYVSTFARIPDSDIVMRFSLSFYEALFKRKSIGLALSKARQEINTTSSGQSDIRGRLVAANYLHYGNPSGYLFEAPESAIVRNDELERLILGMIALLQGNTDEAHQRFKDLLDTIDRGAVDSSVVNHLIGLLNSVDADQAGRKEVQNRLKANAVYTPIKEGRIGAYEILEEIGHGSYRTLYRARSFKQDVSDSEVALALPYNQNDDVTQRQCEAFRQIQTKIEHPGLIKIHDVAISSGLFFIAYEYINGYPLAEKLASQKELLSIEEACQTIEQIGLALEAAHRNGLVHSELTPREVLLTEDRKVKIVDIGRVGVLNKAGLRFAVKEDSQKYRAPEQWMLYGQRNDPSADIWALAVMAYEMLTGHHPFEHVTSNNDWHNAVLESLPYPPSEYRPDLPPAVAQVLWRALSRSLDDRYGSAAEFINALRRALHGTTKIGGFEPDLELALETGATLLYVQSDDELTALDRLEAISQRLERNFYTWRLTSGIGKGIVPVSSPSNQVPTPFAALEWIANLSQPAILVLLDFDLCLNEIPFVFDLQEEYRMTPGASSYNPPLDHGTARWDTMDSACYSSIYVEREDNSITLPAYPKEYIQQRLEDLTIMLQDPQSHPRTVIILASTSSIPEELSKEIQIFSLQKSGYEEISQLLHEFAQPGAENWLDSLAHDFTWHANGLDFCDIRKSLQHSVTKHGKLTSNCLVDLKRNKEQIVRRRGLLELWHPSVNFDDVVGLDHFKEWFSTLRLALEGPVALGLLPPLKGVLLGGMPGCGKSLCAKAIAGTLEWPLVKLDIGRIFGGLLGQSEENMREALIMAEEMSPVVMWVDEIEKGFGQAESSATDATSLRVFQTFLTWLQERTSPIFLVATANEESHLPPELIRAGRFDECFFLDWPNHRERADLIKDTLLKNGRSIEGFDFETLAINTAGFSSAELTGRIINAFYLAAQYHRLEPTPIEVLQALTAEPKPIWQSPRLQEQFNQLRERWRSFALPASLPDF